MKTKMKTAALAALGAAAAAAIYLSPFGATAQNSMMMMAGGSDQVWDAFGGNQQAQKYSTATQITPENVKDLKRAWSIHTGDVSSGERSTTWGATPLFVNDTVYVGTPWYRIFADEPDTGKTKWVYAAGGADGPPEGQGLKSRGVAYWAAALPEAGKPCQKMVYVGTQLGELHGVDADTGKKCAGFGNNGVVNVDAWSTKNKKFKLGLIQPPAVYKDTLILGWAGLDWVYKTENPGTVFGIDARTGALKWTFNIIPPDMENVTGTANVWASISVDPETGLAFLPTSSPSPNYYGGDRLKEMPYATATVAVKAETGEVVWSRQLVHHDIWDVDTNSAPTLLDIKKDGQVIPALIQATKMGYHFVLNRNTGEPVWPIEERPYPASDVPGEVAAKTQPYVPYPEPTIPDTMNIVPSCASGRPVTSPNTVGEATMQGKPSRGSTVPGVEPTRAIVPEGGITVSTPSALMALMAWGVRFTRVVMGTPECLWCKSCGGRRTPRLTKGQSATRGRRGQGPRRPRAQETQR